MSLHTVGAPSSENLGKYRTARSPRKDNDGEIALYSPNFHETHMSYKNIRWAMNQARERERARAWVYRRSAMSTYGGKLRIESGYFIVLMFGAA
jgi:hypothetical protein